MDEQQVKEARTAYVATEEKIAPGTIVAEMTAQELRTLIQSAVLVLYYA